MATFVVSEGLDGSGKTTVARLVADALGAVYMTTPCARVRVFREELLHALGPCQEAAQLFYLATVFAASRQVDAHLDAGRSVILDRYLLSTQAYAEFRGSALQVDELERYLRPADVTVYVHAPLAVRRERVGLRHGETAADRETFAPGADARLMEAHVARSGLRVVGRLVTLDTSCVTAEEAAARVLKELQAQPVGRA